MSEQSVYVSIDRKGELESLIRNLPGILAGRLPDERGIARDFQSRLAYTFLSLVQHDFERKALGQPGADGDVWAPLSQKYLAYVRPVTGRKPPRGGGKAPGGNDGLLTDAQMKLWNRTYAQAYGQYVMREGDAQARAHAAAVAWIVVKEAGGKTKLDKFGNRVAGVDYTILRDTSALRNSLMVGQLMSGAGGADYIPAKDQTFEARPGQMIVGTAVRYAKYHHHGKGRRRRRLWPERIPDEWWRQIVDQAAGGLVFIFQQFK